MHILYMIGIVLLVIWLLPLIQLVLGFALFVAICIISLPIQLPIAFVRVIFARKKPKSKPEQKPMTEEVRLQLERSKQQYEQMEEKTRLYLETIYKQRSHFYAPPNK